MNRISSRSSQKFSRCDVKSTKIFRNVLCFYIHSRTTRCYDQHQSLCDEPPAKTRNIKLIASHPNNMSPLFKTRKFCRNQTPSSGLQKNICSPSVSTAPAPRRAGEKKRSLSWKLVVDRFLFNLLQLTEYSRQFKSICDGDDENIISA